MYFGQKLMKTFFCSSAKIFRKTDDLNFLYFVLINGVLTDEHRSIKKIYSYGENFKIALKTLRVIQNYKKFGGQLKKFI